MHSALKYGIYLCSLDQSDCAIPPHYAIIEDKSKFKALNKDPTITREIKLQKYILNIEKKGGFKEEYSLIYPVRSNIARIYGTPKVHKLKDEKSVCIMLTKLKLRPIISSIGTYNYHLAKYLKQKLAPHIPHEYCIKDTFNFVTELNKLKHTDKHLISFDVVSLYTNIPLKETIDLAVNLIKSKEPKLKITKAELTKLFHFATAETHFLFEGNIYDQIDGVAMGSPLAPVLANLFMGHHEKKWLDNYVDSKPLVYKRYVDDIFCLFDKEDDAPLFLDYLNKQHPSLRN